jgi:hypothetical protein
LSRLQESRRDDDEAGDMEFYSGEEGGDEVRDMLGLRRLRETDDVETDS